ncbi:dual specificity protein phosphatase family protein [Spiroplasma monobiae]|uniref:Tyrosine specific protein phosphatases domain-containing protein n=1 Tax=Spiroplasma monobiae MQ-1 TaxID=1336748 RepID=A0A2K9LV01_SPISQ|nr:dual specificity protein phosphatase [Spiroplasma monobiae]AUM62751.1 hypothetical protein SMONO_v1c05020 [Spiroplasma monobiae MQ-1]
MSKKIAANLYLGDRYSAPTDSDLIISCAKEIFFELNAPEGENKVISEDKKTIYYDFEDYPFIDDMDEDLILDAIKQIENNIEDKKIYVHCVWGINRSASIVFMYMVRNKRIIAPTYETAQQQFLEIYPNHSPNPGWAKFLKLNFPYDF